MDGQYENCLRDLVHSTSASSTVCDLWLSRFWLLALSAITDFTTLTCKSLQTNRKYKCHYSVFVAGIRAHAVSDLTACHSGKATAKSAGEVTGTQNNGVKQWPDRWMCVSGPSCLVSSAEEREQLSRGSSRMGAVGDDDSESLGLLDIIYLPIPFSWAMFPWLLFIAERQVCSMDRWMDVSGGWAALWVDSVSAVVPMALSVISGLCLNKALSKSLRWRGARCLTRGPSVGRRRGRLSLCNATMSVLVERLSPLILIVKRGWWVVTLSVIRFISGDDRRFKSSYLNSRHKARAVLELSTVSHDPPQWVVFPICHGTAAKLLRRHA